jgi:uncharacterized protein (TIGR03435 family)
MRTEELLALGMFERGSRLRERIEMLLVLGRDFSPRISGVRLGVGTLALLGCLIAGSLAPRWIAFAEEPAFAAASVKVNKTGGPVGRGRVSKTPGRFVGTNAVTRLLIREAYGVKDYQLTGGPGWLDSDRFDVEGKADGAADAAQLRAMLRTLLAERFKLVVHRETREMAAYNLVAGKNGVKFPEIKPGEPPPAPPPLKEGAVGTMFAANFTALADMLSSPDLLGRPVLDKTGIVKNYLIAIQYGPDEDMVTIVQDQGLKLESVKAPIEFVVIDHAEKPDAN